MHIDTVNIRARSSTVDHHIAYLPIVKSVIVTGWETTSELGEKQNPTMLLLIPSNGT